MNVEPFGGRYAGLTPRQEIENAWDAAAGRTLVRHARWLLGDPVPIEVVESWANFVGVLRYGSPDATPDTAPWQAWWCLFVDVHLAQQPEFKEAVAAAVGEPRHIRLSQPQIPLQPANLPL